MALPSTMVWRVNPGGAVNNGGAFDSASAGTNDYSKQTSPQYTPTSVLSVTGTSTTILYAAASSDMLGNAIYITSSTGNWLTGLYCINAVSAGVSITLDRAASSATATTGSGRIGGYLSDFSVCGLSSNGAQPGNKVMVSGSFSFGASFSLACSGTNTNPISLIGYTTSDTDGYQGRAINGGSLVNTKMPVLNFTAFRINYTGAYISVANMNVSSNVSAALFNTSTQSFFTNCIINNSSTSGSATGIFLQTGSVVNCDIIMSGGSGGNAAIECAASLCHVSGNRITAVSCPGVLVSTGTAVIDSNLIYACSIGINISVTGAQTSIIGNTIAGHTSEGIKIIAGGGPHHISNNMITDNGTYGINVNTTATAYGQYNRFRGNGTANVSPSNTWVTNAFFNSVTGSGAASVDYTNTGTGDYSLISTSPAVAAGFLANRSIGAFQRAGGVAVSAKGRGIDSGGRL